jgi:hypothetical protein
MPPGPGVASLPVQLKVVFRSAKERPFAERKATINRNPTENYMSQGQLASHRPRPRSSRRRLFLCLGLLALAGVGLLAYFLLSSSALTEIMAEIDRQDAGWRLEEIEAGRQVLPEGANSALQVMAVKKLLGGQGIHTPATDKMFDNLPPQVQLNLQQTAFLDKRFAALEKAVAEARKLKDMPEGRYPVRYSADFYTTVLFCQDARASAELLQWDAARRSHAEDAKGALESCVALFHAARSMGDEPTFIPQLVRYACNAVSVYTLERTLAQAAGPPEEVMLKQVQAALEAEMHVPTFFIAVRGERAGAHRFLTGVADGTVQTKMLGAISNPAEAAMMMTVPGYLTRQHTALLRYLTQVVEAAKLPHEQAEARLQALEKQIQDEPALVRHLAPAFGKVREAERRNLAYLRGACCSVAAERFRVARNEWPASLEALVAAGFLGAVPSDPYDGKALRCKRALDGLVIYSVGQDRVDNGGVFNRERPMDPGTDLAFRLWDVNHRRQPPNPPVPEEMLK